MKRKNKKKIINHKELFSRLNKKKQDKIIDASIEEFANLGYELASTNKIAKKAGIAKGSLFKYFGNKERLFYTVASHVLTEYRLYIRKNLKDMPSDIIERMAAIQNRIYDFFGKNPMMLKFFSKVLTEKGGVVYIKHKGDWQPLTKPIFMEMLDGADLSRLRVDLNTFLRFIKWVDFAIDAEIMENIRQDTTVAQLKKMYRERLEIAGKVLRKGLLK